MIPERAFQDLILKKGVCPLFHGWSKTIVLTPLLWRSRHVSRWSSIKYLSFSCSNFSAFAEWWPVATTLMSPRGTPERIDANQVSIGSFTGLAVIKVRVPWAASLIKNSLAPGSGSSSMPKGSTRRRLIIVLTMSGGIGRHSSIQYRLFSSCWCNLCRIHLWPPV